MKKFFKITNRGINDSAIKTFALKSKDGSVSYVKAKNRDAAIKFIRDARTALGEEIIASRTNPAGQVFAVIRRAHDYAVIKGFHKELGTYEHGYFGFPDEESARDFYNKIK